MQKEIKNFPKYYITDEGKVISYKFRVPRVMRTWYQKSGYENIKLCKNNRTYHFLIHRLVGEAFLDNPLNFPEINHKDGNRQNNNVSNLEWCDRKYNLLQSYNTSPPIRNFCRCVLFHGDEKVKEFVSISSAASYAHRVYGSSQSGLVRNFKSKEDKIIKCND